MCLGWLGIGLCFLPFFALWGFKRVFFEEERGVMPFFCAF